MKAAFLTLALLLLAALTAFPATKKIESKPASDIFAAFRQFDTQFTALNTEFRELQAATAKKHASRKAWRQAARKARSVAVRITKMSSRMYDHSQSSQHLRRKMFADLHRRARLLTARFTPVERATSREAALRETRKAERAMLDLILQYQAISGGYAASNCEAGQWTCGVAKAEPRQVGYPTTGVKWSCVPRAAVCRGILGPHTPMLAAQPLTAVTTPTK